MRALSPDKPAPEGAALMERQDVFRGWCWMKGATDMPAGDVKNGNGANQVRILGRVSGPPEVRTLVSGDELWTWRVVVRREQPVGKQSVDVLDCVAWSPRARRTVSRWRSGDEVEVMGSLRRRFFRGGASTQSRTEVEMKRGRLVTRAIVSRNAVDGTDTASRPL